jgi:DNA-directed RNA polymerase subunit RPC12/RpoP
MNKKDNILTEYWCARCGFTTTEDWTGRSPEVASDTPLCPSCGSTLVRENFDLDKITNFDELKNIHQKLLERLKNLEDLRKHFVDEHVVSFWEGNYGKKDIKPVTEKDLKYWKQLYESTADIMKFLQEVYKKYNNFKNLKR